MWSRRQPRLEPALQSGCQRDSDGQFAMMSCAAHKVRRVQAARTSLELTVPGTVNPKVEDRAAASSAGAQKPRHCCPKFVELLLLVRRDAAGQEVGLLEWIGRKVV